MRGQKQRKWLVLAFGTRGDVQPLALLAASMVSLDRSVELVTHRDHACWLEPLVQCAIILTYVTTPPALPPPSPDDRKRQRQCSNPADGPAATR